MTDFPSFDPDPGVPAAEAPPKKPRRKPMKKRRKVRVARAVPPTPEPPKQRRKVRKIRVANGHAGGRYTKEQYRVIGALMSMSVKERDAVLDIVKGLSK